MRILSWTSDEGLCSRGAPSDHARRCFMHSSYGPGRLTCPAQKKLLLLFTRPSYPKLPASRCLCTCLVSQNCIPALAYAAWQTVLLLPYCAGCHSSGRRRPPSAATPRLFAIIYQPVVDVTSRWPWYAEGVPMCWPSGFPAAPAPVAPFFGSRRPHTANGGTLEGAAATSEVADPEREASLSQDDQAAPRRRTRAPRAVQRPAAVSGGHGAALSAPALPGGRAEPAEQAVEEAVPEAVPEAAADATAAAPSAAAPLPPQPRRPPPDGTAVVSSQPRSVLPRRRCCHASSRFRQLCPLAVQLQGGRASLAREWSKIWLLSGRSLTTEPHLQRASAAPICLRNPTTGVQRSVTPVKHCRMINADANGVASDSICLRHVVHFGERVPDGVLSACGCAAACEDEGPRGSGSELRSQCGGRGRGRHCRPQQRHRQQRRGRQRLRGSLRLLPPKQCARPHRGLCVHAKLTLHMDLCEKFRR